MKQKRSPLSIVLRYSKAIEERKRIGAFKKQYNSYLKEIFNIVPKNPRVSQPILDQYKQILKSQEEINKSITPILDTYKNLGSTLKPLIKSTALSSTASLAEMGQSLEEAQEKMTELLKPILENVQAYQEYSCDQLKRIGTLPPIPLQNVYPALRNIQAAGMAATSGTASVTRLSKFPAPPPPNQYPRALPDPEINDISRRFADELRRINPNLPNKLRGAWMAINSNNPDRASQAANSMVELFREVFETIAPDNIIRNSSIYESLKEPNGRVTYRMRIRYALAQNPCALETTAQFSWDNEMINLRNWLEKIKHGGEEEIELLRILLVKMEAGLYFILLSRR